MQTLTRIFNNEFCWLSISYLENWYIVKLALLPLFTFVVIKLTFGERVEFKSSKLIYFLFFCLVFVTILLCWIPNIVRFELNPDESQWVAQANNFYHNPDLWIKYFWPREFSRIFTIIPLAITSFFNYPIKWLDARVFSVILWSLIIIINFFAIKLIFSKNISAYSSIVITWLIAFMIQPDNIAYNSELPSIFLIVLIVYLVAKFKYDSNLSKAQSKRITLLIGILLPCLPFVKEQNFYISLLLELFFIISVIKTKEIKLVLMFFTMNVLTFVLITAPLLFETNSDYFINQLGIARNYYSKGLLSSQGAFFANIKLFFHVLVSSELGKLFFVSLFGSFVYSIFLLSKRLTYDKNKFEFLIFSLILLAICSYSVYAPGNFFGHYYLLLFPACALLLPYIFYLFNSIIEIKTKIILAIVLMAIAFWGVLVEDRNFKNLYSYDCFGKFIKLLTFNSLLEKYSATDERIFVWGWKNAYYVENGLLPGSRDLYIIFLDPKYEAVSIKSKSLCNDILFLKPKLFIELVGDDQGIISDTSIFSVSKFKPIEKLLMNNYSLIGENGNQKLYLRN
jgi:hypothetical protein